MGGSPCSGKSSIAKLLSDRYELQVYNCDDAFYEHGKRVTPLRQPAFHQVLNMTWDEIWMRPVKVQLGKEIAIYWVQEILSQCENPGQAFQNWTDRDIAFARWVAKRATDLGLELLQVDGKHTIVENAEIVEAHFQLR